MNKCLLVQLKDSFENPNLTRFGYITVRVNSDYDINTANDSDHSFLIGNVSSTKCATIKGTNGNKLTHDKSAAYVESFTLPADITYPQSFFFDTPGGVYLVKKDTLGSLNSNYGVTLNLDEFGYMPDLKTVNVYNIDSIFGSFDSFCNDTSIETLGIRNTALVTGTLDWLLDGNGDLTLPNLTQIYLQQTPNIIKKQSVVNRLNELKTQGVLTAFLYTSSEVVPD